MRRRNPPIRSGYTLIELLVATGTASVVAAGMASTVYIASQALDVNTGAAAEPTNAAIATAQLREDLRNALAFTERTATSATFTVPDRTGDSLPETVRYAWSGVEGDPLTRAYNGGAAVTILDGVESLSLEYLERFMPAASAEGSDNSIWLLVDKTDDLSDDEAARQAMLESWGYTVQVIKDDASQDEYDAAFEDAVAFYVPTTAATGKVDDRLRLARAGVVCEGRSCDDELGFSTSDGADENGDTLDLVNVSHPITDDLSLGGLTVAAANLKLGKIQGTRASGATRLADVAGSPVMLAVSTGGDLANTKLGNDRASGRRVRLPFADDDLTDLNDDGLALIRSAVAWAADPAGAIGEVVYQGFTEAKATSSGSEVTIDSPADLAEGDLLIAVVVTDGSEASELASPAGWNEIHTGSHANAVSMGVWWKLASADESAGHQFTWNNGEHAYGFVMRFTGHDPAGPIHAVSDDEGSSSSPNSPGVTTTADSCLILRMLAADDDDIDVDVSPISGYAIITMDESTWIGGTCSGGAVYTTLDTAGHADDENFTLNGSEEFVTVTVAIQPEPPE